MQSKPSLREVGPGAIQASHPELGEYWLYCEGAPELLFTENESNAQRLWGQPNASPYVKDAFHAYVISGQQRGGESRQGRDQGRGPLCPRRARRRQQDRPPASGGRRDQKMPSAVSSRYSKAGSPTRTNSTSGSRRNSLNEDERRVHRQALAGMLWSKQYYYFDLEQWLREHKSHPLHRIRPPRRAQHGMVSHAERRRDLHAGQVGVPWYAAWDLAFHTISLSLVDFDFAKEQLLLMLRGLYFHPNGQIPAYEWNFSDVNPPVHAWATLFLYKMERTLGRADLRFLERSFQGLMLNFNWWVNRKDPAGRNVFAGGFLGLDNIGVFDRSAQLPTGGSLEQADGTAWMAFYCQCMLEMALILTEYDPMYEEIAFKFVQHFMWISYAMDRIGEHHDEMWDEQDGFFYDLLRLPDGQAMRLKVRSLVGLLPLCASTVFEADAADALSEADGDDRPVPQTPSRGGVPCGPDRRGFHRL